MRSDMAKVIVERPRIGGHYDKPPAWEKNIIDPDEQLPSKEGMRKRHYKNRKQLNENLGPLINFLKKRVGTPWNDVYSEICKNLNMDSAVQKHVRDHVWDFVRKDVFLIKGHPYYIKYGGPAQLDVGKIVRALDKAFEDEIRKSRRQPGEYAIKGDRLEYRSLPNSAVELINDRIPSFLNKIKKAVED